MDLKLVSEIVFLALAVWREARDIRLPHEARVAVACSILNRVDRPSWWGDSILSVVFKKWQYSSLTDPKDRQLTTWPQKYDSSWQECVQVAFDAIAGTAKTTMRGADSYFDTSIPAPKWATPDKFVGQIGTLMFYDIDRDYELKGK